jgi:tetratricopeptide (TPR) repeat protein
MMTALAAALIAGCASVPPVVNLVSLDEAIAGAAASVEEKARTGEAVAVVKINSPLTALSDFLAGELETRFAASGKLTALARGERLAGVNAEQQFQMSGLVSDESAAGIGRFLGAQIVISGDFTRFANFSQLAVRAVEVETGRLLAAYTAKIAPDDPALAGITAPLGPAAGQAMSEAALEHLNLGKDYLVANIPDIALEELNRALAKNRNFAEARFYRGKVYEAKSQREYDNDNGPYFKNLAIADYTEAIRLDPNNAGYYITRGSIYGNDDRAIADFARAIRLDPNSVDAYQRRAWAYQAKKDTFRAMADWTEAIRLDPNDYYYYYARGNLHTELGGYDYAIADYTEAIRLFPPDYSRKWECSMLYDSRAQIYRKLSQNDQAIADLTEAIRISPAGSGWLFDLLYQNRAQIYVEMSQNDRAIADYIEAARFHDDPAKFLIDSGNVAANPDRAIALYSAALRLNPNDPLALELRGLVYLNKNDYDLAIADYTAYLRLDPNDIAILGQRGWAYHQKRDYDRAIADYTQAIRLTPDSAWAYNKRGDAYYSKKNYAQAIADYEAALRIYPDDALARTGLENARKARGY